jgi:hypothetical protein
VVFFNKISFFTAVETLPFLLLITCHLAFRNISGVSSISYGYLCLLVYFVWVSLFSGLETVIIVSSPLFSLFLGPASKVIIEADNDLDKIIHCFGKLLNNYYILNISLQSLIELCHLSALVLGYPRRILREACEVFGDGALLFRRYELELCRSYFVEVFIGFIKKDNILFNILQYFLNFWGILDYCAYI